MTPNDCLKVVYRPSSNREVFDITGFGSEFGSEFIIDIKEL